MVKPLMYEVVRVVSIAVAVADHIQWDEVTV